ncbi:hypothetical protein [Rhizobium sp. BE258]|uniref:hypothetical protein n=1 Tax=Rhizobium sp. BE258 TaxID=2817722 RepID=UPI002863E512|nr:hypothetical protein [Rhizobium sp. BE258]MDR7146168.1 hypothetical protein [Rhizobium sp. BE258]
MGELDNIRFVVKAYNWQGAVIGYNLLDPVNNTQTLVPLDAGNRHYRDLLDKIERGVCEIREPEFTFFSTVNGRGGAVTGHDTNLGFVPADSQNTLRQLLDAAIASRTLEDRGIAPKAILPQCSHLKLCLFFPRPWPHLAGPLYTDWRYRSDEDSFWTSVGIRLSNHPDNPQNPMVAALSWLGLETHPLPDLVPPLQQGLLEVEFSVKDLWALYRSEHRVGFGPFHSSIEDRLQYDLVRYGRVGDSPDMRTLLALAPMFLRRAAIDVANNVAREFNKEFGGDSVGFIKELDLQQQHLCLLRDEEGIHHFWQFGQQPPHSFNISGSWDVAQPVVELNSLPLDVLTNRLRALIDGGFTLEAISVANGFYEQVCRGMVGGIVASDAQARAWVLSSKKFGYDRSRSLLLSTFSEVQDDWVKNSLMKLLEGFDKIYVQRNAYMHALRLVGHDLTRSVDMGRDANLLLKPLLDAFEQMKLAELVNCIREDGARVVGSEAEIAAITAVRGHMAAHQERGNWLRSARSFSLALLARWRPNWF